MKKLLVLIMGLTLIFALAACGSKADTNGAASTPSATTAASDGAAGQTITLKASNFKFEYTEYHVKKGQPVTIKFENAQGMHGAAIKDLGIDLRKDGDTVTITPDKIGSFQIICSIMCGAGHNNMKANLIVE